MRGRAALVGVLVGALGAALVGCTAPVPTPTRTPPAQVAHPHASVAVTVCPATYSRGGTPRFTGAADLLIPFTATDVLVCHYAPFAGLELQKQIDDPRIVATIERSLNSQRQPFPTGGISCPADSDERLSLFFWNANKMIAIFVGMSGCGGISNGVELFQGRLSATDRLELGLPATPDPFSTGIPATTAP